MIHIGAGFRRVACAAAVAALLLLGPAVTAAVSAEVDHADLEQRVRDLEEEIARLQKMLERVAAGMEAQPEQVAELERKVEILIEELERRKVGSGYRPPGESVHGLGPAASKVYQVEKGVSIGGYGEMLYESFDSRRDDGEESGKTDQLDFLRAVLYFGYKFNDRILFNSEIEFEHADTGENGSVSVEFAYLDFMFREPINVRAGLLLTPVGFLNELHEPPIFLGARRPDVERVILPTTWRENGAGVFGDLGPVAYRVYIQNGLDAAGFSAGGGLRGGRQKGSKARAEDFALTARFDWTIVPGLQVGVSGQVGDSGQGAMAASGEVIDGRVLLYDLHAEWRWRGLQVRGLLTEIEIGDAAQINELNGFTGDESVGAELRGYYGEVGYDVLSQASTSQALIPFARYESWNTQQAVPDGFTANPMNNRNSFTLGLSYLPIPQVVIKVDYQERSNAAGTATDQINMALGYLF